MNRRLLLCLPVLLAGSVASAQEITPGGSAVTASTNDGNVPPNAVDNSLATRWSANGDNQWLQLDLGTTRTVTYVSIAFYNGNLRTSRFDIQTSTGGGVWTTVWSGSSNGTQTTEQTFDFTDVSARWVRYLGHGNSVNMWNSITEISIFGSGATPVPTSTPGPGPTSTPRPTPTTPPSPGGFKQIGYMPSWAGSVSSVQYQYLTHINYAFALPNSNGTLKPIENTSKLSSLVSTAHSRGVKVMLSIGGWNGGNDSAFETFAASSTGRTTFVNACVNVLNQYGLDGIDIDWEYPDPGTSATNYQNLMNQLCSAMRSRGKLCTAAVVAQGTTGGGVSMTAVGYMDYIQIMAYDANNGNHSSRTYADTSLSYWLNRGVPKSKAVLGVPFYARPSWAAYNTLLAAGCSSQSDSCSYQGATNYYNGIPTIAWKRNLALTRGGGIMTWELSQDVNDSRSLLRAMSGNTPLR
jgi:GH18 family chitinase